MKLFVQSDYKSEIAQVVTDLGENSALFQIANLSKIDSANTYDSLQSSEILIGDLSYLNSNLKLQLPKVLISEKNQIDSETLKNLSAENALYIIKKNQISEIKPILKALSVEFDKKSQIQTIKTEIQKKRKELEYLNNQLTSESAQKIESLERSHIEETEKNQKEKSLLHFLDFVQSESFGDDFFEKIFRFIWKDIKKYGRVNLLGLSMTTNSGKSKIIFFDGAAESTSIASVNFQSIDVAAQLASVWGRPVAKILSWQLPESSRETFLFFEIMDGANAQDKVTAYVADRLAVLSMYMDRWMIEKEMEVVVDRWKKTFKSFSGSTHVVDENFKIYQSNYPHQPEDYCYKILAKRDSPCESCPILLKKNSNFILKDDISVKTYYSQFKYQSKNYYFVIYEDVTKLNMLHSQIIQTEKMSTLGRLGNHLAHELNNPLTGIKSYVQTLLQDQYSMSSLPATANTDLEEILKAAVRCQKIIRNFIDFSQKKEPILEKIHFNEVVQNTVVLLKTALRPHRLYIDLKNDVIVANAHDLQQVLFNLIKNSCQAMQQKSTEHGTIKIYEEIRELGSKTQVLFHLEDTGPGFDESILKNIFQPFMTTKEQGEGTGLGLYLSKKLMNNMNADLQVTSSNEKGAKISLIFDKP